MTDKEFDYLIPQITGHSVDLRGYVWKVIVDPTRNAEGPGLFFGRLFRMMDLRLDRDEKSTWPDGIVFEHVSSGDRLTYQGGVLMDLTNSKAIQKKPRVRNRSQKFKNVGDMNNKQFPSSPISESPNTQCRRFVLVRREDLTGTSGTGDVAEGMVFSSGLAVINWLREPFAVGIYQTVEDVITVHGHEGRTQVHFID